MFVAVFDRVPIPRLAADEILHTPLPTLASYIRQMTNTVMQEKLDKTPHMVATVA
jgi:hypothetical protein